MLPTHRQVGEHRDVRIYQRMPGFEYTPIVLAKIASYVVYLSNGQISVFAFLYSLLAEPLGRVNEDQLLREAVEVIQRAIDADAVPREDATYEYHDGRFVAVERPRWWIPVRP